MIDLPTTGYMVDLLASRRAAAEQRMVDTCIIRGPSTRGSLNQSTGKYTETPGAVLYQGKCERNTGRARLETVATAGDHDAIITRTEIRIPASAARIQRGATVEMTACPNDPASVGTKYDVQGPGAKTWATAQRFNVTEVVG